MQATIQITASCTTREEILKALTGVESELKQYQILYDFSQRFVNVYEQNKGFLVVENKLEYWFINELATEHFMVSDYLRVNPKYKPKKMQMVYSQGRKFWFIRAINQHEWVLSLNFKQAESGQGDVWKVKYL